MDYRLVQADNLWYNDMYYEIHLILLAGFCDLFQASLVCKSWLCLAFDELLWKDLFHRHWNINRLVTLAAGKQSWVEEYKRLLYHVPTVEIEVVKKHTDEVLHVSFSNNGKMFTTTSKDGFVKVSICFSSPVQKYRELLLSP